MSFRSRILPLAAVTIPLASAAQAAPWDDDADDHPEHARPVLVSEHQALVPGETNYLGVSFEMDEGWHIYWHGRNDTGFPTQIDMHLPRGWEAEEVLWPAPVRYISPGDILDHVYKDRVTHLVPVRVPKSARPGERHTITADLEWLVCKSVCIPGWGEVSLEVEIAEPGSEPAESEHAQWFKAARERIPVPLEDAEDHGLRLTWEGLTLVVRAAHEGTLAFFPHRDSAVPENLLQDGQRDTGPLRVRFRDEGEPPVASGVIEAPRGNGRQGFFTVRVAPGGAAPAARAR